MFELILFLVTFILSAVVSIGLFAVGGVKLFVKAILGLLFFICVVVLAFTCMLFYALVLV